MKAIYKSLTERNARKMNIQSKFNQELIDSLPKIKKIIEASSFFEANQITCFTLRKANNSRKAVNIMTAKEKKQFQEYLISAFKFHEWVK
tara:strand:+ start:2701 stop:2970 length:270 start_codon:yes stop_codon:yes gene_type:complete